MTKKDHIHDDGRVGKYFTTLYNMADDDLNPYQYRLLGHYKRVCGETEDGACWESTRTTAKKCQISVGKVASTRRELEAMGYVAIETRGDDTLRITMIDRMAENVARYTKRSSGEHSVHEVNTSVHTVNTGVHEVKQRITTEEKPVKNNQDKKENATSVAKSSSKQPKKPDFSKPLKDWSWVYLEQYACDNPIIEILVALDDVPKFKNLATAGVARDAVELFKELQRNTIAPDRWKSLYTAGARINNSASIFKRMLWALPGFLKSEPPITIVQSVDDDMPKPTNPVIVHSGEKSA